MITLAARGLPPSITDENLREMFSEFGSVHFLRVIKDALSGDCRGIAFIGMDGAEAQAAIAGLDGKKFKGRPIRVELNWSSHGSDSGEQ